MDFEVCFKRKEGKLMQRTGPFKDRNIGKTL
jgi:hypothetical protein